jgi:glutamate/tyrosine decarboxylase-like PLP-dependent enzyme
MATDPLALDPETMRRLGYQVVDWLVDRAARRVDEPVLQQRSASQMRAALDGGLPHRGHDLGPLLDQLGDEVLPYRSRIDHPRYLAYVPGEGTWPGALGDLIASAYNIDAGNWMESAGPSHLETVVLRWFAEWIGFPDSASGALVSGGSAANLTALACAREALSGAMRDDLVVYVSDQGHSSLARAARNLGFRPEQVRVLPVDEDFRMRVDALVAAIEADLRAGRHPLAVLAVAGTTNTGSVDDLPALAEVCRHRGVWLHVDAAYGGFASLSAHGRRVLAGIELADSVTLDPHKWLYQPIECGALLVREGRLLREAFEIHPSYLEDTRARAGEVNFGNHGLQLTRTSRALKVWLSLQYFGADAFATAVDGTLALAQRAQRHVEACAELDLMAPATLGVVCFRRHPVGLDDDAALESLNSALVARLADSGRALVSSTRLRGRYAVRCCILNHATTWADVQEVLDWFAREPVPTPTRVAPAVPVLEDLTTGWPNAPADVVELLRSVPLLDAVGERWLRWIATVGRRRRVPAGEAVIRQWEVDREFFLLLGGTADVVGSTEPLGSMGAGDFFGELAALDWGAGFGYPRLATVTARTDLDLLVLSDAELRELMAAVPRVDAQVRAVAGHRSGRI